MGRWATRASGTAAAGLLLLGLLGAGLAGCTGPAEAPATAVSPSPPPPPPKPPKLALTPVDGAKKQPLSTEIGVTLTGGRVTGVTVQDAKGRTVEGDLRDDGSSWVPAAPLQPRRTYTATVTAQGPQGGGATASTTFTTMSAPGRRVGTGLYLFDGNTYGTAMPVVVEFMQPVPDEYRAAIQRRLFVTTVPAQPGVWHWSSAQQVTYRAHEYWKPGTEITVRAALDGVPMGSGRYGDTDRRATVSIADTAVEMKVSNKTKQMKVYRDGTLLRQFPISLGKRSTPSSSGIMVIMDKARSTVFDTRDDPQGGYRVTVAYAQRLTWGGEFIHAAPWSVGDQGVRNVSHGCINMSTANAAWLFRLTRIGDPVTVTGTEVDLVDGNGFTAWSMPWDRYVEGSALPVPAELLDPRPAAAASPGD